MTEVDPKSGLSVVYILWSRPKVGTICSVRELYLYQTYRLNW
ncbi:hypothetical protein [Enterobacter phage 04_vB_Eclo_IJM]|nr:hypothetical protein [Enterobacter phage 04_vB_Eclo_IJM]